MGPINKMVVPKYIFIILYWSLLSFYFYFLGTVTCLNLSIEFLIFSVEQKKNKKKRKGNKPKKRKYVHGGSYKDYGGTEF